MIRHYSEFVTHPVSLRQIKTVKVPKEKDEFEEDDEPKKDEGDDVEVTEDKEEAKEPEMEEVIINMTLATCSLINRAPNSAHRFFSH